MGKNAAQLAGKLSMRVLTIGFALGVAYNARLFF
jgi:hypothetical protein